MSRFASALHPDDREWVEELVNRALDDASDIAVTRVADAVAAEIERLAEHGDWQAVRAVSALVRDGLRPRVLACLKADRSLVRIAPTGELVSLPARMGVRAVDEHGHRLHWFQQPLWWEMTWEQFLGLIRDLEAQRDKLDVTVAVYRGVAALRDKHPDTRTPGEACAREGIDPRSFGVERGAA